MPTYEYECLKCGKNFEVFQSMKDEPFATCPAEHCQQKTWGKGKVKRVLGTGAGILFKGSGFYQTDYRSDSYKHGAKQESAKSSGKSGTGDAKSSGKDSGGSKKAKEKGS